MLTDNQINQLRLWWHLFKDDNELVEIRVLGDNKSYSGYYKDINNIIRDISEYESKPSMQLYFTLNSINSGCYGREQNEHLLFRPKTTTSDTDISRRKFILIDLDPKRATGVNSSDEEFEYAHIVANSVYKFLKSKGFKNIIVAKSGNGWHLAIRVDVEISDESNNIVKRFLSALGMIFSDDKVDIDLKVFNPARICKLYGTTAKKGANIPERPYRLSEIVKYPETLGIDDFSLVEDVANIYPEEDKKTYHSNNNYNNEKFNLDEFLKKHEIGYKVKQCDGFVKYVLDKCIFNEQHTAPDAAIFQFDSGAISYVCLHNSCRQKTWHDVLLHFDPDYDKKRAFNRNKGGNSYGKPQYKIIEEDVEELGKKWLSLKDIKRINIYNMPHIKTGINGIDKSMLGLFGGEVTILSGLNASGKSSLLNTFILNALQQDVKTALWTGELTDTLFLAWFHMSAAGRRYVKQSQFGEEKYYVPNAVGDAIDTWADGKFFLRNNDYGNKWQQVLYDMQQISEKGIKLFVLDNLFSLDIDIFGSDKNTNQKEMVLQLCDFAKKKNVHIILVAHPRKTGGYLRKDDISGSSDIMNAASNIFIVHRVDIDFLKRGGEFFGQQRINEFAIYGNVVEIAKNRIFGRKDEMYGLYFEKESRRFLNSQDENIFYGWEDLYNKNNEANSTIEEDAKHFFDDSKESPF